MNTFQIHGWFLYFHFFSILLLYHLTGLTSDWPRFRGPGGSGVALDQNPPVTWSATDNIAWKVEVPGPGTSSPVVFQGRVYLTCHTGYGLNPNHPGAMNDLKRHLLVYRSDDGALVWQKEIPARLPETEFSNRMHWHGYASSTPAVDKEGVVCFFGKSGVHAWTHDGAKVWQSDVGEGIHGWGSAASPVIWGNLVFVNAFSESGSLVALDRGTGELVWNYQGLKEAWNTPAIVQLPNGESELVVGLFGFLIGLNPQTGIEKWRCKAADYYVVGSPVVDGRVVYSLSGKGFEAATAVKAGGTGEVTETHRLWQTRKGSNVSSPVVFKNRLYFAHEQGSFFYCLNAGTGETIYQERLPSRFGMVYGSPVLAGNRLYLFSREGGALVIEAGDRFKILSQNPPLDTSPVNSSPAVVDDGLLIRSDSHLYFLKEYN